MPDHDSINQFLPSKHHPKENAAAHRLLGRFERRYKELVGEAEQKDEELSQAESDAADALTQTRPVTIAGAYAALKYVIGLEVTDGYEILNNEDRRDQFFENMDAALNA